jgi:ankyrin repeat protein
LEKKFMEIDFSQLLAFLKSPTKWLKSQLKAEWNALFTWDWARADAAFKEQAKQNAAKGTGKASSSSGTPRATVDRTSNQKTLDSEIIAAAGVGNTIRVKELLDAGADVHASVHAGWRNYYDDPGPDGGAIRSYDEPLKKAAENGHVETVRALLQAGAHVNQSNQWYGGSAIERAASKGQTEVVKLLILSGANVRIKDDVALRGAAEKGHTDTVAALLAGGADVHAHAALHMAAGNGHVETVRALLQAGAHVDSSSRYTNSSGFIVTGSPIEIAAAAGQTAVVKLLIDSEAGKRRGYVAEADGATAPTRPLTAEERLDATIREATAEVAAEPNLPKPSHGKRSANAGEAPANPNAAPTRPMTADERLDATIREAEAAVAAEPRRPGIGRSRARGRDI